MHPLRPARSRGLGAWRVMASVLASMLLAGVAAAHVDCGALDATGNAKGAHIPGHLATYEVIGTGRARFYSAPSEACVMSSVFVVPRDRLVAYVEYKGFIAVMYVNPKTGVDTEGWVRASRIRGTGEGISPE